MKRTRLLAAFAAVAFAFAAGCLSVDDNSPDFDVNDEPFIALGAKAKTPWPVVTNKMDGLETHWKNKGKIYNDELIVVDKTSIHGLTVVEEDVHYKSFSQSGESTNMWVVTTVTNNNKDVELTGSFEDIDCFRTNDGDGRLRVVLATRDEFNVKEDYDRIWENPRACHVYKAETFDTKATNAFDRVQSVSASDVVDRAAAIDAFNALLTGLKAQLPTE